MKRNRMKFIYRLVFFLSPNVLFFITFPRNLAQIFRSDRSRYVWKIFFHNFYTFEVMTHFVAEEASLISNCLLFLNKLLGSEYCSLLFLQSTFNHKFYGGYQILTLYKMKYGNYFTKKQCKKNAYKIKRTLY